MGKNLSISSDWELWDQKFALLRGKTPYQYPSGFQAHFKAEKLTEEKVVTEPEIQSEIEPEIKDEAPSFEANQELTDKIVFLGNKPKDYDPDRPEENLQHKVMMSFGIDKKLFKVLFWDKEEGQDKKDWLHKELCEIKPRFVILFGAFVTGQLLGPEHKISKIRGKIFPYSFNLGQKSWNFSLVPLFHPDILAINPNMKRSAWKDIQKFKSEHLIS